MEKKKEEKEEEKKKPRYHKGSGYRRSNNQNPNKGILISVVVPLYNEAESLEELTKSLEIVLNKETRGRSYEIIYIDDGSTDNSFEVIQELKSKNNKIKAIRFRRNYGKSAALSVGFAKAKGAVVITMDADLQDDPSEIPALMKKIRDGYDLVSGWKKKRYDPISKTLPSKFFNFVTSLFSGLKLHDFNCGLKAYRRDVAKSLHVYGEMHRYLPVLAHWDGFRVTEIPVTHHPRKHGKSKFGASRFIKGFLDLLTILFTTRYLKRPLHFFGTLGFLSFMVGLIINIYLTIEWTLGLTALSNRPLSLFGIALIIVGVQFISLGLLGEMIVKNYRTNEEYHIRDEI